jgi:hypothetical protein
MSVLSRDEFFEQISKRTSGDTSPETIEFIENMTDTYNSLSTKNADNEKWKQKYDELDKTWRTRYTHRFFSGPSNIPDEKNEGEEEDKDTDITIDDLFK